ncbi:MAG: hypothetical protein VKJ06_09225 [Vampirovibrionales bacterium]|nr:hypothetical protein [Vampirovibrionales bacterium]
MQVISASKTPIGIKHAKFGQKKCTPKENAEIASFFRLMATGQLHIARQINNEQKKNPHVDLQRNLIHLFELASENFRAAAQIQKEGIEAVLDKNAAKKSKNKI